LHLLIVELSLSIGAHSSQTFYITHLLFTSTSLKARYLLGRSPLLLGQTQLTNLTSLLYPLPSPLYGLSPRLTRQCGPGSLSHWGYLGSSRSSSYCLLQLDIPSSLLPGSDTLTSHRQLAG
jgi:hypothetical protein